MKRRSVVFFKNYFELFYNDLDHKAREKVLWVLKLIEELDHIPEQYLKHLSGTPGLYEIRVRKGRRLFRIFCWFDKNHLVVIGSGFQKKSQRTPRIELKRALRIKAEYYEQRE